MYVWNEYYDEIMKMSIEEMIESEIYQGNLSEFEDWIDNEYTAAEIFNMSNRERENLHSEYESYCKTHIDDSFVPVDEEVAVLIDELGIIPRDKDNFDDFTLLYRHLKKNGFESDDEKIF